MIIARYYKPGERIHIERAENGRYFIRYNVKWHDRYNSFIHGCSAGPFDTEDDARRTLKKHRPGAVLINSICNACRTECNGTAIEHYTGCVYKTA